MKQNATILVVDDEKDFAKGISRLITSRYTDENVITAFSAEEALGIVTTEPIRVMLTDLRMPGMDGLALIEKTLEINPDISMIMLTAHGSIETAVHAVKSGAYDFLTKPIEPESLFLTIGKSLERSRLKQENTRLKALVAKENAGSIIIGHSPSIIQLKRTIEAVAGSDYTVLIRGESGTGKELAAKTVHSSSKRRKHKFVTVNCPAIPEQLLESELFGHVKGAFTGADSNRKGLFEEAKGGTIHLDEIGDISLSLQAKLLRVLQEQEIRPVGSNKTQTADVRIVASTNQDLETKIKLGEFREDLFYRLNVLTLQMPTLTDRAEDIPLLAQHFIQQTCKELNVCMQDIQPEPLAYLSAREWKGNVRELQNFIRKLVVFSQGESIDMRTIGLVESPENIAVPKAGQEYSQYKDAKARLLDDFTRTYLSEVLSKTEGNISEAARESGLSRVALQKMLTRIGMDADTFRYRK
ncbi:MAG: sigma-54-dependent transcriptional regulator [Desulfovibrio sp.]